MEQEIKGIVQGIGAKDVLVLIDGEVWRVEQMSKTDIRPNELNVEW